MSLHPYFTMSDKLLRGLLLGFSFLFAFTAAAADSICFFPNGAVHSLGIPCHPNAEVSACCGPTHTCLSNGLCWDLEFNHVIRGGLSIFHPRSALIPRVALLPLTSAYCQIVSCTDSNFASSSCPQYCISNDPAQLGAIGDIRQCANDNFNWICGMNSSDCTNSFSLPWGYVDDKRNSSVNNILADGPTTHKGVYAAATETVVVTVTMGPGPAFTSTTEAAGANATPTCSPSSSSTIAAGLGAGLGVGIPLLIALSTALIFLRKTRRENAELRQHAQISPPLGPELSADNYHAPATGWTENKYDEFAKTPLVALTPICHPLINENRGGPVYEAPGN